LPWGCFTQRRSGNKYEKEASEFLCHEVIPPVPTGGGISFSPHEAEIFLRTAKLYEAVKALMLFGEEISPRNLTFPQILKEQRDAFEHFMRVIAIKTNMRGQPNPEYIDVNLDKMFSHVYRAAYDTLDWISILLRNKIAEELHGYSASAIEASMPTYYTQIRPKLESVLPRRIAEIRGAKDVGMPAPESIGEYADLVEELKGYHETITRATPSLMDYSKREKRVKWKEYLVLFLIGVAFTALGIAAYNAWWPWPTSQ